MKKNSLLLLLLLLQVFAYGRKDSSPALQAQPLSFLENKGQIRDQKGNPRTDIDFILQAPGMTLYIGQGQLHYQFMKEQPRDTTVYTQANPPKNYQAGGGVTVSRLDVSLEGANKDVIASKEEPQKSKYHYYTGASPAGVTGVAAYGKIVYKNIYPFIDWVLYTNGKSLKYDFVVHPGGQVSDIQMKYEGAQSMQLQKDGSLKVSGPIGSITEATPYIYEQESKQTVGGKFLLDKNTLSYQVTLYKGTLVIDPGVEWATYFGGGADEGVISKNNMACDLAGYIYLSGRTMSQTNLATTGAYQDTFAGGFSDGFLAKFDSLGQLQWATYYGGTGLLDAAAFALSGGDVVATIACDAFGHVYVAGQTFSATGIATPGSYQDTGSSVASERGYAGGNNGFLVKFDSDGIRQWGTYYGASTSATGFTSVACDPEGNVYAAGFADSSLSTTGALVTPGAHQTVFDAPPPIPPFFPFLPTTPCYDGLLVKFDSSGNRQWATYFGQWASSMGSTGIGLQSTRITDLACDASGNVYITGSGPGGSVTAGAHQPMLTADVGGFLSKFDPNGTQLWGTYLNSALDGENFLFLDSLQHLYVAGTVRSQATDSLIVSAGCYQPIIISIGTANFNGFLMQMNPNDGTRHWGTFYGAEKDTRICDVTCDAKGDVYIAGSTNSYGDQYTIATPGAYKDTFTTGVSIYDVDAFVAQFDSSGMRKWASYYGDTGDDQGTALICDPTGALYVSGTTKSTSAISTPGSYQDTLGGASDVFLVRWLPVDIALKAVVNPEQDTVCAGDVSFSVSVKNQGRLDLEDTLKISYTFNGPSIGSLDTFFTSGLIAGAEDIFDLGSLDLAFPGDYDVTVYLHVSRGDQERTNDTIRLTLTATNAEPVANITVNQVGTVFHFNNPDAQPSDQYHWDFGDGETSTDANPTHEYEVTDSYEVTLVVTGFCGSDTATVMIAGIGDPEDISDPALAGKLSIYPNPAAQILYLKAEAGLRLENYSITNALGQQVQNGALKNQRSLNLNGLASGSYFIRITTDKGTFSKQFQVLSR